MIGLLFLICLMLTLKEIKKNVKRFLVFYCGSELFPTETSKQANKQTDMFLCPGHNVQACKLICLNAVRRPFKAEVSPLCCQSIRDKDRFGFVETMLGRTAVKCYFPSFSITACAA